MADTDQHEVIAFDLYCPDCGYNLRGLTGDKCPECGASITDLRSGPSNIPWAHRRQSGRTRAYWRTVFWASRRARQFGAEIGRPVSYREAQAFRWVTLLHVQVSLLVATFLVMAGDISRWIRGGSLGSVLDSFWPPLTVNVLVAVWLAFATGIPSYFFDYRDLPVARRNSAVALSYYCCGPLALTPLAPAIVLLGIAAGEAVEVVGMLIILVGCLLPLVLLMCWWLNLSQAVRQAMPYGGRRLRLLQIGLPSLWVGAAVFIALLGALTTLVGVATVGTIG